MPRWAGMLCRLRPGRNRHVLFAGKAPHVAEESFAKFAWTAGFAPPPVDEAVNLSGNPLLLLAVFAPVTEKCPGNTAVES